MAIFSVTILVAIVGVDNLSSRSSPLPIEANAVATAAAAGIFRMSLQPTDHTLVVRERLEIGSSRPRPDSEDSVEIGRREFLPDDEENIEWSDRSELIDGAVETSGVRAEPDGRIETAPAPTEILMPIADDPERDID